LKFVSVKSFGEHQIFVMASKHPFDQFARTPSEKAVVVFQASIARQLASSEYRLPANFVGVRHVRLNAISSNTSTIPVRSKSSAITFVVIDEDGKKRRMTKAEKKSKKRELEQQRKLERQRRKIEGTNQASHSFVETSDDPPSVMDSDTNWTSGGVEPLKADKQIVAPSNSQSSSPYHQMPLNAAFLEEERAEVASSRLVPAILSPPMAWQFYTSQSLSQPEGHKRITIIYDHSLSQEWADRLHTYRVLPAENLRNQEDLRPLAYRLKPEPWQRMRPSLEAKPLLTFLFQELDSAGDAAENIQEGYSPFPKSSPWISMTCRPPSTKLTSGGTLGHDHILAIVFEYLHRETPYYVSCGAKFGSDFLLYDGPREERHAFAGLRVLSSSHGMSGDHSKEGDGNSSSAILLPLPTAYSLTSYVRCLNTAGKLALLATVVSTSVEAKITVEPSLPQYQVLFVDVALEKVLEAPTHKRKRNAQSIRKDVTKNLAKT
jgi:hypothetical protein